MPLEQLLALAILAFVGSFTPGPNNMIATVTGANHGFRAALPHVFGVPFGFASMLIAGAAGVAALLLTYPFIAALLKWAGIAYLLFMAWQLARPHGTGKELNRPGMKPLSFWQSAAFHTPIRRHGCSLRPRPDRSWQAMRRSPESPLLSSCFRSLPCLVLSPGPG